MQSCYSLFFITADVVIDVNIGGGQGNAEINMHAVIDFINGITEMEDYLEVMYSAVERFLAKKIGEDVYTMEDLIEQIPIFMCRGYLIGQDEREQRENDGETLRGYLTPVANDDDGKKRWFSTEFCGVCQFETFI